MADLADDDDMRQMAEDEILDIESRLPQAEDELKFLLLPKDPNDEKNVILEIRAGTGGDEATLFAAEILANVRALRGTPGLENGSPGSVGHRRRRHQRSRRYDRRRQCLFEDALRVGSSSRPACPANRNERPHSHFSDHRCCFARGRRG